MKKLLLILLCLPMIGLGQQMTYVHDDNFEQALINLGFDNVLDDFVQTSSIDTVKGLQNFGDGNTSNLTNPNHIYSGSGNFTITLTAYTNSSCQIDISTATISVSIPTAIKENTKDKILIRTTNILGRNCMPIKNFPYLYFYNDGTMDKKVILE